MTESGEVIVYKKDDFLSCMGELVEYLKTYEVENEEQQKAKSKIIELINIFITKDIYTNEYIDHVKIRPKKRALYRICQNIGTFYNPENRDLTFFVMIFLGVPYQSFEKKEEQLLMF